MLNFLLLSSSKKDNDCKFYTLSLIIPSSASISSRAIDDLPVASKCYLILPLRSPGPEHDPGHLLGDVAPPHDVFPADWAAAQIRPLPTRVADCVAVTALPDPKQNDLQVLLPGSSLHITLVECSM